MAGKSPNLSRMHGSKLIELVQSFSGRERRQFGAFVASPYFNRNEAAGRLWQYLAAHLEQPERLRRSAVFEALFPGEPYNNAALNHLMSMLLKLAERFLAQQQFDADESEGAFFTLKALAERDVKKHYQYLLDQYRKRAPDSFGRTAFAYLNRYRFEDIEADRLSRASVQRYNDYAQKSADYLDYFYLAEKLRYACFMLTSQIVLATPYKLPLLAEITRFVQQHLPDIQAPSVKAYFHIAQMFSLEHAAEDFEALKQLLQTEKNAFTPLELSEIYQYAINFCNLQILKLREEYVEEALNLYVGGVASRVLMDNNVLSPWHFKNIIKLALRLKRFAWTEKFILDHVQWLDKSLQQDALNYNLAELYYFTRRYDAAMERLREVEFADLNYNLGGKVLLIKIYYETDAVDALDSLLHAFKTYLRRHRLLSEDIRKTYLNFILMVDKMVRGRAAETLRAEVQGLPLLTEKTWLLDMLS